MDVGDADQEGLHNHQESAGDGGRMKVAKGRSRARADSAASPRCGIDGSLGRGAVEATWVA